MAKATPVQGKIDFRKTQKELYSATAKVKEVTAGKGTFLSLEGTGEPGGAAYVQAIQQLYTLAYTAKFMLKACGGPDFSVCNLECLWHTENIENVPKAEWQWQLLIRIPDQVKAADLKRAATQALQKRGVDTSKVARLSLNEGRCVQTMHVGPYDQVGETYRKLDEYAVGKGLKPAGPAHEIYISDPSRVVPEKLKTIVRLRVG